MTNTQTNDEVDAEMAKAWIRERDILQRASPKQAFRLGFLHGRISGSSDTGKAMIAAVDEAVMKVSK